MDTTELENKDKKDGSIPKGAAHIIVELVEYEHNASVSKSILKKTTGSINAMSFDTGEGLNEKSSPYDTYAQVIEGDAIVVIEGKETKLNVGEGIVIPANKLNHVKPNGRFKMLLTVIKSAYQD